MSVLTQADVEARIAGLDEATQRRLVCALVGHSRIQTTFFGYYYCARCEAQVGDTLASVYDATRVVIVGHNCVACRGNFAECDWRDTFLSPDPFAEAGRDHADEAAQAVERG